MKDLKAEDIIMQSKYSTLRDLVLICEAMDDFATQVTEELKKEVELMTVIVDDRDEELTKLQEENNKLKEGVKGLYLHKRYWVKVHK